MRRMYFHIGKIKCHKTYGYIGNTVYQIEQLLFTETSDKNNKVFYLGDEPSYEINEWADEIASEILGLKFLLCRFELLIPCEVWRLSGIIWNSFSDAIISLWKYDQ